MTHKLVWNFNIQTDHLIPAKKTRPNNNQQKEENLQNCRLCCPGGPQNKSEGMCKEEYVPRACKRIEKAVEHESNDCANCDWCSWHNN